MTDVIKTSPVAPPSIALAMMALNLAGLRVYGVRWGGGEYAAPVSREFALESPGLFRAARAYYDIIDRISAGEAP